VLHEVRTFRLWAESRLDDVSRDLKRICRHQEQILSNKEHFHRSQSRHPNANALSQESRTASSLLAGHLGPKPNDDGETMSSTSSASREPVTAHEPTDEAPVEFRPRGYAHLRRFGRHVATSFPASPEAKVSAGFSSSVMSEGGDYGRGPYRCSLHPESCTTMLLDMVSVVMLAYDLLVLPIVLAWEVPSEGVVWYGGLTTVFFWTLDMFLGFLKAYEDEDKCLVYGRAAMLHYLRTWFALDAAVLCCDWVSLWLEMSQIDGEVVADFIKLFRILKLNRFLRVIAIFKMGRLNILWDKLQRAFWSVGMLGQVRILFRVGRFLVPGMLINHWCACVWYSVGKHLPDDGNTSWLQDLAINKAAFQYTLALQWAVSHMFGGSPVILAKSTAENVFTVVAMTWGAICGSILISLVATMMMDLQNATLVRRKQVAEAQRFVHDNKVSHHLASAILRQVKERTDTSGKQLLKDVALLHALSAPLWRELAYELYAAKILRGGGFLLVCCQLNQTCMKDICGSAIKEHVKASHDELFSSGSDAKAAYFIKTGSITYFKSSLDPAPSEEAESRIDEGNWLAEVAIWVHWQHCGTAMALRPIEVLSLMIEQFETAMKAHPDVGRLAESFGRSMSAYLTRVPRDSVSDLPLRLAPTCVEEDMVMLLMPPDFRVMISQPAMSELGNQNWTWGAFIFGKKSVIDLEAEVEKGNCLLKLDQAGRIVRCVSVAVLRLTDIYGRQLVHMGSLVPVGVPLAVCEYPATKARAGETPEDALQRLIAQDIPLLAKDVAVQSSEVVIHEADSSSYGMPTKYLRTVFHATLLREGVGQLDPEGLGREAEVKRLGHRSLRSSVSRTFAAQATSPVASTKSSKSGAGRSMWLPTRSISKAPQQDKPGFDPEHRHAAYHFAPASRSVFSWLLEDDISTLKQNRSVLVPWLQDIFFDEGLGALEDREPKREEEAGSCSSGTPDMEEPPVKPVGLLSKWHQPLTAPSSTWRSNIEAISRDFV